MKYKYVGKLSCIISVISFIMSVWSIKCFLSIIDSLYSLPPDMLEIHCSLLACDPGLTRTINAAPVSRLARKCEIDQLKSL